MKTVKFQLEELTCPSCITKIECVLMRQKGVEAANVLFSASKVKVKYRDGVVSEDELATIIENVGYPILAAKESVA